MADRASLSRADVGKLPKHGGVYRIRNTVTGQVYIGATCNLRKRARQHVNELQRTNGKGRLRTNAQLKVSIQRHGLARHVFEVLARIDDEVERLAEEQRAIEVEGSNAFNDLQEPWRLEHADLTTGQMRNMRAMSAIRLLDGAAAFTRSDLAERFGVSVRTVSEVVDVPEATNG